MKRSEYKPGGRVRHQRRTATLRDLDQLRGIVTICYVTDDAVAQVPLEDLEVLGDVSTRAR
jgi:hypothetical protein